MILFGELQPAGTYPHVTVFRLFWGSGGDEASELQHLRSANVTAATPMDVGWLWQLKWRRNVSDEVG